jgi:hypothetical protein
MGKRSSQTSSSWVIARAKLMSKQRLVRRLPVSTLLIRFVSFCQPIAVVVLLASFSIKSTTWNQNNAHSNFQHSS